MNKKAGTSLAQYIAFLSSFAYCGCLGSQGNRRTTYCRRADLNAKGDDGITPLDLANGEVADLLRKHGGRTGDELKAEGK